MIHLTIRQLNYFVHIVDEGSMTRAGRVLNLAPTALSLQVKAMEDRLGVKLLHRHSRGVRPSDDGKTLYERSRDILAMAEETQRLISRRPSTRRTVHMGLLPSMVRMVGIDIMPAAAKELPDFNFHMSDLSSRNQLARLMNKELQFAVLRGVGDEIGLRSIDIIEERLVFVTSPQEARTTRTIDLSEALSANLAFYKEGDGLWRAVHDAALAAGKPVCVSQLVGSSFVLRGLVMNGLNSAILPFGIVEEDARADKLVIHDIVDQPILQRISLAWLEDKEDDLPTSSVIRFAQGLAAELDRRTGGLMRSLRYDFPDAR